MDRDRCIRALRLERGDTVKVGKARWKVESSHGVGTTFVVKAGTSGKKLYQLLPAAHGECCVEVRQYFGSSLAPGVEPAAKGCLLDDGSSFGGAVRPRRRPRRRR